MKKLLITFAIVMMPVMGYAQVSSTVEYRISILRQLIMVYQQYVNVLVMRLNELNGVVQTNTVPLQNNPVYNSVMPIPEQPSPAPVPTASAPIVADPQLLIPELEIENVSEFLSKNEARQLAFEIAISNVDDTLLLNVAPIQVTTTVPNWTPDVFVLYKGLDLGTNRFKIVKGDMSPIQVFVNNLPSTPGQITFKIADWQFSGQFTGQITGSSSFPLTKTIEVK